jgi:hypothetical protein
MGIGDCRPGSILAVEGQEYLCTDGYPSFSVEIDGEDVEVFESFAIVYVGDPPADPWGEDAHVGKEEPEQVIYRDCVPTHAAKILAAFRASPEACSGVMTPELLVLIEAAWTAGEKEHYTPDPKRLGESSLACEGDGYQLRLPVHREQVLIHRGFLALWVY